MIRVEFQTLDHFDGLKLPAYETVLAAGADLRAAVSDSVPMVLTPGERALVPTGFCMALPAGDIVFDIEIVFLYPVAVVLNSVGWFALAEFGFFIAILALAYVYIWKKGALEWR